MGVFAYNERLRGIRRQWLLVGTISISAHAEQMRSADDCPCEWPQVAWGHSTLTLSNPSLCSQSFLDVSCCSLCSGLGESRGDNYHRSNMRSLQSDSGSRTGGDTCLQSARMISKNRICRSLCRGLVVRCCIQYGARVGTMGKNVRGYFFFRLAEDVKGVLSLPP